MTTKTCPSSTRKAALAAAGIALAASCTLAWAAPSASAVISSRQANYKKMGAALKTLKDELREDSPSRPKTIEAADVLSSTAKLQKHAFPSGSGPESGVKTDALPNIWTNRAKFDAAMNDLILQAGKLSTVARSGSKAEITAQFRETGKTCGACHREFRKDS